MLTTQTYTIEDSIDELDEQIDALEAALEDLDESTDEYSAEVARRDRLSYFRRGLCWQRDEEGWGDAEIELGAMTAGEEAMMHRESPSHADRDEMRLWFVAASTVGAPYASDELADTFDGLSGAHPAFVKWAEAKANGLGVPGVEGNGSAGGENSTSSSPSDSPTE